MNIKVDNITFSVRLEGQGPPLLLLHGFTGSKRTWDSFFDHWKQRYTIIAVDLPGHGNTEAPEETFYYTMAYTASALQKLIAHLGYHQVSILGYSMGGRLGLYLARYYPDLIHTLCLESSSPGLQTADEREERRKKDEALADWIVKVRIEKFVNYWESLPLFRQQHHLSESAKKTVRIERLSQSPKKLALSLKGMGTGHQPSLWHELHRIQMPVLLITGENDQKFDLIAERMNLLLPQSVRRVVKGSSHTIHVEHPTIFDKIVMNDFYNLAERDES